MDEVDGTAAYVAAQLQATQYFLETSQVRSPLNVRAYQQAATLTKSWFLSLNVRAWV